MDRNIINIYTTLLNRQPSLNEIQSSLNFSSQFVKIKIKDSIEFKKFNEQNIKKIKNIFCNIL